MLFHRYLSSATPARRLSPPLVAMVPVPIMGEPLRPISVNMSCAVVGPISMPGMFPVYPLPFSVEPLIIAIAPAVHVPVDPIPPAVEFCIDSITPAVQSPVKAIPLGLQTIR